MLRKIRIILAAVFFAGITLMLLDFTGALHAWLGWMAKVQFLPAVMALNVAVIAALIVLTLLFGRVYCSVICPLGVFQDCVAHISVARKRRRKNKNCHRRGKGCGRLFRGAEVDYCDERKGKHRHQAKRLVRFFKEKRFCEF